MLGPPFPLERFLEVPGTTRYVGAITEKVIRISIEIEDFSPCFYAAPTSPSTSSALPPCTRLPLETGVGLHGETETRCKCTLTKHKMWERAERITPVYPLHRFLLFASSPPRACSLDGVANSGKIVICSIQVSRDCDLYSLSKRDREKEIRIIKNSRLIV